ncbi:MAG: Zinc-finger double domain protein [uncultured archaeon A07HB70]|nr:MAG: Zinc-finger double domain protein [uncultured archaeon A07HB70]
MSDTVTRSCPDCGDDREFYTTARTAVHLGEKRKFRCPDCGYVFVRIDGIEAG